MTQGVSGYFDIAGNYGMTTRVYYAEEYDAAGKTSDVTVTDVQIISDWYGGIVFYLDGTITIEGQLAVEMSSTQGTHSVEIQSKIARSVRGELGGVSGIGHGADGSGSATFAVRLRGWRAEGGTANGWLTEGTYTVELTKLAMGPRPYLRRNGAWVQPVPHLYRNGVWVQPIPHLCRNGAGQGGGLSVTDDGNGNVVLTAGSGAAITDDGNGSVVLTAGSGAAITDDGNGNVIIN